MKYFEGLDCCETTLNTMFQSHNIDLRYIFFDKWNFYFDNTRELVGEALYYEETNRFDKYRSLFNLEIFEYTVNKGADVEFLSGAIAQQIADSVIIMAEVETYYYKFDKGYRKYFGTHYFSIVDCDACGVWIIDSWYKKANLFLDFTALISCLKKIILIRTNNYSQPSVSSDLINLSLITSSDIEKIGLFIERIPAIKLEKEFNNLPPHMSFLSLLDRSLRRIIMNRQRYMSFLQYSSEMLRTLTLDIVFKEFDDEISEWSTLRSIFLQSYFLGRKFDERVCIKTLDKIISMERHIRRRMEDLIW